ncbi:tRNA lysidine(34) synthetase TilS [Winogradskyella maritima]|uniref:tRNA(Ile)-lysidine synthase n=1 Tax=Winogradskyella maritima TaxID=1517766 RepID=A0ABV8AL05_9FLAO|nr:tRNA lysidine(34) synthetase TilS [Winogradskyella maritima]
MLEQFQNHIETNFPFLKNTRLLLAISGGVDSVVLADLCHQLKLNMAFAHCNFNLRGAESDADEAFIENLGEALETEVFIQHFDTKAYAETNKCSIQMSARELRYDWFKDLAQQLHFDYILTAHHADDNLETFLINFMRGTGLNGLTGIPILNENIARPLLPFSREAIEAYAKSQSIQWREDSSNVSVKYLRNKLRHDVIPILKEINPQVLDTFQKTLKNLNDTADIVTESTRAVTKRALVKDTTQEKQYAISEFKKVNNPKAYLFQVFKEYGFFEWDDVLHLLDAESGKQVLSRTHRLLKHRDVLILSELDEASPNVEAITIENIDSDIEFPLGKLRFRTSNSEAETDNNSILLDLETLKFPLELRPWQEGDRFRPAGMKGTKTISKYLKDEKLSPQEKENVWVLTSDEEIFWVVGMRRSGKYEPKAPPPEASGLPEGEERLLGRKILCVDFEPIGESRRFGSEITIK